MWLFVFIAVPAIAALTLYYTVWAERQIVRDVGPAVQVLPIVPAGVEAAGTDAATGADRREPRGDEPDDPRGDEPMTKPALAYILVQTAAGHAHAVASDAALLPWVREAGLAQGPFDVIVRAGPGAPADADQQVARLAGVLRVLPCRVTAPVPARRAQQAPDAASAAEVGPTADDTDEPEPQAAIVQQPPPAPLRLPADVPARKSA